MRIDRWKIEGHAFESILPTWREDPSARVCYFDTLLRNGSSGMEIQSGQRFIQWLLHLPGNTILSSPRGVFQIRKSCSLPRQGLDKGVVVSKNYRANIVRHPVPVSLVLLANRQRARKNGSVDGLLYSRTLRGF